MRGVPIRCNGGLPVRAESPVFLGRCGCCRASQHVTTRKGQRANDTRLLPVQQRAGHRSPSDWL